jgi:hypothetical protein
MGTMPCGAPPGMASRRNAPQPPSRPSRRPEVADVIREGRAVHATAGRRAGAEARQAPNATEGRRSGETGPGALLPSEVLRNTGLLSHSAPPLLQLASLRRPGSRLPIDRQRSPPVVSTAFLVPGTHFSVTRYPGIPCGLAATESRQAAREALSQPPALSGPRACDPHGKGLSPRPLA